MPRPRKFPFPKGMCADCGAIGPVELVGGRRFCRGCAEHERSLKHKLQRSVNPRCPIHRTQRLQSMGKGAGGFEKWYCSQCDIQYERIFVDGPSASIYGKDAYHVEPIHKW